MKNLISRLVLSQDIDQQRGTNKGIFIQCFAIAAMVSVTSILPKYLLVIEGKRVLEP